MIKKKKILAVILARIGSSRLKNKLMLKINNKTVLKIFIERLKKSNEITDFVIAVLFIPISLLGIQVCFIIFCIAEV